MSAVRSQGHLRSAYSETSQRRHALARLQVYPIDAGFSGCAVKDTNFHQATRAHAAIGPSERDGRMAAEFEESGPLLPLERMNQARKVCNAQQALCRVMMA